METKEIHGSCLYRTREFVNNAFQMVIMLTAPRAIAVEEKNPWNALATRRALYDCAAPAPATAAIETNVPNR
jgi:hypothetical protein